MPNPNDELPPELREFMGEMKSMLEAMQGRLERVVEVAEEFAASQPPEARPPISPDEAALSEDMRNKLSGLKETFAKFRQRVNANTRPPEQN